MKNIRDYQAALKTAWHEETAQSSLERWLLLCEQEGWNNTQQEVELLIKVFGASWYFTRFIYVNGSNIAALLKDDDVKEFTVSVFYDHITENMNHDSVEARLEKLRFLKNWLMLKILIANFSGKINQIKTEYALTSLAEAVLQHVASVFELSPGLSGSPVSILGMGRMAGHEMTFGSDLDLIFLYDGTGDAIDPTLERKIRLLLKNIPFQSSMGMLYDVDIRLRPHGNAGVLVASHKSFRAYHGGEREIWERQMMTRCRPVLNVNPEIEILMNQINRDIYVEYDRNLLKKEIVYMRKRVQKELGTPAGKYDVKRGRGGIMDIDFICHYLQLAYGHETPALQIPSTRGVLKAACEKKYLDEDMRDELLNSYDFLKTIEASIRLFDMKTVSTFPVESESNRALSRAMGFYGGDGEDFLNAYKNAIRRVRTIFKELLGNPDAQ